MSNEETTSIRETLTGNPVYDKDISFYALRGCVLMAHDHQRMVCGEIVYLYDRNPGARRKTWQGFAVRTFVPFRVGLPTVLKTRQFYKDQGSFDALLLQAKEFIAGGRTIVVSKREALNKKGMKGQLQDKLKAISQCKHSKTF